MKNSRGLFGLPWLSASSLVLYLLLWLLLSEDGLGIVRKVMLPGPITVLMAAGRIWDTLLVDILATLARVLVGLISGAVAGVVVGLAMSYSRRLYEFFNPLIEIIRPVPVIAMIPFFLMWFGISEIGKFLIAFIGVFAIIVVSTMEAIVSMPKIYGRAAATLGASQAQIYRTIVAPAIIPTLSGPLRVAGSLCFTLVVAAEFMGAPAGLGYRILEARRLFSTDVIVVGITLIGFLAAFVDAAIRFIVDRATKWSHRHN